MAGSSASISCTNVSLPRCRTARSSSVSGLPASALSADTDDLRVAPPRRREPARDSTLDPPVLRRFEDVVEDADSDPGSDSHQMVSSGRA